MAMLNGPFLNEQAGALAARLRREAGEADCDRARLALRLTTGREPTDAEVGRGVALIRGLSTEGGLGPDGALRAFALVALNLNEFLYLD